MVSDTVQDVNQVVHNVGMAAWVGGTMFGRLAHNPSLTRISSHTERGAVASPAWNAYNVVNLVSATAVGVGHLAGRLTELRESNLSEREKPLVRAMDVLTVTGVVTGLLNAIQGARLARQAPGGAVPVETGTRPAADTPPRARRIQCSIDVLGLVNRAAARRRRPSPPTPRSPRPAT